jgi:hypothetical protein
MYGFCRITDISKSHFNFSSKNCSSKVYTGFVKVVGLVIQSTKKIGFAIIVFFYNFISNLQVTAKTHKEVKNYFTSRPLESFTRSQICPSFAPNTLEILGVLQCSPWANGGGAVGQIPARPAAGLAGKG